MTLLFIGECLGEEESEREGERERDPTDDEGSGGVPDSLTQFHRTATVSTARQSWIHPGGLKELILDRVKRYLITTCYDYMQQHSLVEDDRISSAACRSFIHP